jgi:hypothetical protein
MFTYPLPRTPRVALLHNGLNHGRSVRYFDDGAPDFIERLAQFRPESFAGSFDQLMRIARADILCTLDIRAIVVFAPAGSTLLSAAERDELWRRFGAPVFEQQLNSDGELVATECEAHDGLHIMDARAAVAGAALDHSPCPCGKTTARIRRDHSGSDAAAA